MSTVIEQAPVIASTTASTPPAVAADHGFDNGHFAAKGSGDNIYRGPLEPLAITRHASIRAAAEAMYTDGYVTVPEALDRAEVAELRALMDSMGGPDEQYEHKNWCFNKHVSTDFHGDARLLKYIDRTGLIEVVEAVLGPACRIIGGSMWVTGKGRAMGMHIDSQPLRLPPDIAADPRVRMPIFSCTVQFYLDDQTADLGATMVVPGSHRAGRAPVDESSWNGVAPQMVGFPAGGACLFRPDLWHGAAMNSGERRRYVIQVHYGHHTIPVTMPAGGIAPAVLAIASPRQRRLLGLGKPPSSDYSSDRKSDAKPEVSVEAKKP